MISPYSIPASSPQAYHTMRENCSTEPSNHPDQQHSHTIPPPAPSILDLFRMAASRGDLADLPRLISGAVTGHNPRIKEDTLRTLLHCLAELGLDFKPIHETVPGTRTLYCPRCGRIYRDVDNGPGACIIRDGTSQSRFYSCCGVATTGSPASDDTDKGICYVRPHTQIDDSPLLSASQAYPHSDSGFQPQPALPTTNIAPMMALATTSDSVFPSCIARTDTGHPSLKTTSRTVNPAAPAASEFALTATRAEPQHLVPVDHIPMMADAHSPAAQWWTEAPPPPYAFPSQNSDAGGWSWSMHDADADAKAFAAAMRAPLPEVTTKTIP